MENSNSRPLPSISCCGHWTHEVVFYPAAILIGEYLKLRFEERDQSLKV